MAASAFVAAAPVVARSAAPLTSSFASRPRSAVAPTRRTATVVMSKEKIPQGFTAFSEQLNGRAAMVGFIIGLTTEAITGQGIVAQVDSVFEVVRLTLGM